MTYRNSTLPKWAIPLSNAVAHACFIAAERLEDIASHLKRCPDCGRLNYYGAPCVGDQRPSTDYAP